MTMPRLFRSTGHGSMPVLLAVLAGLALGACKAPAYGPSLWAGASGYSERQLDARTYSVNFAALHDDIELARRQALFRCAQLAQQDGFSHFRVKEQSLRVSDVNATRKASASFVIETYNGPAADASRVPVAGTEYAVTQVLAHYAPPRP